MTAENNTTIYGLLPGPNGGELLILPCEDGWTLPKVVTDGTASLGFGIVSKEMSRLLGCSVAAIRYVLAAKDGHDSPKETYYALDLMERVSDSYKPAGYGRWISEEEFAPLKGMDPNQRQAIESYFSEERSAVPDLRQPWERSGWYRAAGTWIESELRALNIEITGSPEQVKWWSLSCVLRIPTGTGDVYFKTSARQPLFVSEPRLLACLSRLYPGQVPSVLASDMRLDWMLLPDAGLKLERKAPAEQIAEVLLTFGRMQLDSVNHTDELLRIANCADRRPPHAIPLIASLLEDELVVSMLSADEIGELRRQLPVIIDMCARLSDYSVPATLVHGDLHLGNVVSRDGRIVFFDWTDGCVAHPFMDMLLIFNEQDEAKRTYLRDAYLKLWLDFESMERLLELWSLCEVAHAVYHTISYQSILRHTEARARWELGGAPAFHLRMALRYLRDAETSY
jgi:hypothetical protein